MNSSDSGRLSFNESLPIPKLIKLIKHSFNDYEFDEVQNILIEREKNLKYELLSLVKDRDLIKEEVTLLERNQALIVREKLKLKAELQSSEANCEKLNTTISRLIEEQNELRDKAKTLGGEMLEKVSKENSELRTERNKLVSENERMKQKNLENEHEKSKLKEKLKSSEANCKKLNTEISSLTEKRNELRDKEKALGEKFEKVRKENSELRITQNKLISENERMKKKNLENENEQSKLKEELQSCEANCKKLNATISRLIEVQKQLRNKAKTSAEMFEKVCKENLEMRIEQSKLVSENERIKQNFKNEQLIGKYQEKIRLLDTRVVKLEQDVNDFICGKLAHSEADQAGEEPKGQNLEAMEELTCKTVVATQTINESSQKILESEKVFPELNKSRMADTRGTLRAEIKGPKQDSRSEVLQGVDMENKGLQTSGDIIEIHDSSNEKNNIPLSGRGNKRVTPSARQGTPTDTDLKKSRNECTSSKNGLSNIETAFSEKNGDFTESDDDSCSDSYMNNLVASLKNQNRGNKF